MAIGLYERRPTKPELPFGSLSIVIIGAGIAGLTAALALTKQGHNVIVLEKSRSATEQGAAIQLPPNCSILLNWLGLNPEGFASDLLHYMVRHDRDGNLLFHGDLSNRRKAWAAEWYCVQRVVLHNALKDKALAEDITLHTGCKVARIYADEGKVELRDGRRFHGDVLLGADGVNSITRETIIPEIKPTLLGMSGFRWVMPVENVAAAMSGKGPVDVIKNPGSTLQWDDVDRRLLAYPCASNKIYNMLAYLPSSAAGVIDESSWSSMGSKENLVQAFSKFSPEVQRLVGEADDSLRVFVLSDLVPLSTWVSGRTALLGDAAHIFQPYTGQRAAMAIEDAVSIATMLPMGTRPADVQSRLKLYEKARLSRVNMVRDWAAKNRPGCVPLGSPGGWWVPSALTKLNTWRVLAQTALFMQQTFGHDESEYSSRFLQQALARRPSMTVDDEGHSGRRSSLWSFMIGDGQAGEGLRLDNL